MKKTVLLLSYLIFLNLICIAQKKSIFDSSEDIGNPGLKGYTVFDSAKEQYILTGSGKNIWATADQFHFASLKSEGDVIITAFCSFQGRGKELHRKMGIMIREKLDSGARYADAVIHGDGLTSLQYREKENGITLETKAEITAPDVIQLERRGDTIILRAAKKGEPLKESRRIILKLKETCSAGIFICSHNADVIEKATFSNLRIDVPAKNDQQNNAASRLEMMDVRTGMRKVIYTTKDHIEAPNWSKDGKFLLFNSGGYLYKLPLNGNSPEKLYTGEIKNCNNDHGLSFDGKMIAISSGTKLPGGKSGSMIYTVPVQGGIPKAITTNVPSYWHGWSPDGKILVYCAERNGNFDVWGIPSNGGEEYRLTTTEGLDDGPEYSPEGRYIYFNSVRSGKMKIWRMAPDGSKQEQVSFGNYQDWFAHLSPDGKNMIYVSYPDEVPAGSHPANKRVMIRLQPVNNTESKVLAYVYGGQGTMNVPSWSPDSRSVAFVSFTFGDPNR